MSITFKKRLSFKTIMDTSIEKFTLRHEFYGILQTPYLYGNYRIFTSLFI